jgi:hypothetical protein
MKKSVSVSGIDFFLRLLALIHFSPSDSILIRGFVAKKAVGVGEILNGVAPLGLIGFASFYHFLGLTPEAIDLSRRWR